MKQQNRMKAMQQLSKLLTPEEFYNLMSNIITLQEGMNYHTVRMYQSAAEFLIGSFSWDESNEGWIYWSNIYNRIKK